MTYDEALNWINQMPSFSSDRYGLEGVSKLLDRLKNPHLELKYIHIAGTNGKGSTAVFCASSLIEANFKTGLFISPYILDYRERIQINGEMISENEFVEMIELVKPYVETLKDEGVVCSHFDIITAVALKFFCINDCDIVVLETGMGGRLDSTNVIPSPQITILTHISYDHMKELGNSIEDIAIEKAGILKKGSMCVCNGNQLPEVKNIINSTCIDKDIPLIYSYEANNIVNDDSVNKWNYNGVDYATKLIGKHQVSNAMLAITALLNMGISDCYIKKGILNAYIPARLEKLSEKPLVVLDGAHNPDGMAALNNSLKSFNKKPLIGLISMLKTKDYKAALCEIKGTVDKLIVTQMNFDNVVEASLLFKVADELGFDVLIEKDISVAAKLAKKMAGEEGMVVVLGSLYFASQVRSMFLKDGI